MMPHEARALCLHPDLDKAHAEFSRNDIGAAQLRDLLGGADESEWRARSTVVELSDKFGRRTDMSVHVPPYRPGRRLGALILLHGAGGSGEQVLPYFTALGNRLSMAVVAPTAQQPTRTAHNLDLAGIFGSRFRMPRWDLDGEDFPLAALRWVLSELGADPDRCVLTGVSMGGLATWNLSMRFWHSFAAAVPFNGALSIWESFGTDARTRALLPNTLPLPLFVVHGAEDERIPARSDRESVRTLRDLGHENLEYVEVPEGAHGLDTLGLAEDSPLSRQLERWLGPASRPKQPAEIRHRANEDAHGRAHWVGLDDITPQRTADVHARWTTSNRIDIEASGARRVALYLRGDRLAPGETIRVTVNGIVSSVRFAPDLATVHHTFRETADPGLVAEQVVRLDVPQPHDDEPTEPTNRTRCRVADSI
ncbi:dienelactone hydrolase family protein [Streptomyces sp. NRRL F-5630]|uniref:dienelactone hydrolase family protein n=1 Tax=Streptomyces sp. NRRL F-5630 TaxID=1463864 RepID=UPI003D7440DF